MRPERPAERRAAPARGPHRACAMGWDLGPERSGGPGAKRRVAASRGGPRRERRPSRATGKGRNKTSSRGSAMSAGQAVRLGTSPCDPYRRPRRRLNIVKAAAQWSLGNEVSLADYSASRGIALTLSSVVSPAVGPQKIEVINTKRLGQFEECYDSWIAEAALKVAQVLLAKPRASFDVLLRQALCPTEAAEIPADQLTHIHAQRVARLHTISLSTIVCKNMLRVPGSGVWACGWVECVSQLYRTSMITPVRIIPL